MALCSALLALFAAAAAVGLAAVVGDPPEESAPVPDEALAAGDECLSSGGEAAECALSAIQRRTLHVAASTSPLPGPKWRTEGVCDRIITVEDCQDVARRLNMPYIRTHCHGPSCAPKGCYQFRSTGSANNLHIYWNSDKAGSCTETRQCLCEFTRNDPDGYVPPATARYAAQDPQRYGYTPAQQALLQEGAEPALAASPGVEREAAELRAEDARNFLTVFHQTSPAAGANILQSGFRPGVSGVCGRAIYFSTSPDATDSLDLTGRGFMIEAKIDMGRVKWMPGHCDSHMTGSSLRAMGYDSIRVGRGECGGASSCGEVVIYDKRRVVSMRGYPWQAPKAP